MGVDTYTYVIMASVYVDGTVLAACVQDAVADMRGDDQGNVIVKFESAGDIPGSVTETRYSYAQINEKIQRPYWKWPDAAWTRLVHGVDFNDSSKLNMNTDYTVVDLGGQTVTDVHFECEAKYLCLENGRSEWDSAFAGAAWVINVTADADSVWVLDFDAERTAGSRANSVYTRQGSRRLFMARCGIEGGSGSVGTCAGRHHRFFDTSFIDGDDDGIALKATTEDTFNIRGEDLTFTETATCVAVGTQCATGYEIYDFRFKTVTGNQVAKAISIKPGRGQSGGTHAGTVRDFLLDGFTIDSPDVEADSPLNPHSDFISFQMDDGATVKNFEIKNITGAANGNSAAGSGNETMIRFDVIDGLLSGGLIEGLQLESLLGFMIDKIILYQNATTITNVIVSAAHFINDNALQPAQSGVTYRSVTKEDAT